MESPIEYPTVIVAGRALVVKCSLYAQLMLSRQGKTISEAIARLPKSKDGPFDPHLLEDMFELWRICTAENYARAKEPIPTVEEWACLLTEDQWGEVCQAVGAALVKALRPAIQAGAPAANTAA